MTPNDEKELSRFFPGVNLSSDQLRLIKAFESDFHGLAEMILRFTPSSADRSSAMRYLRLAQMQVKAAICHDWPEKENDSQI